MRSITHTSFNQSGMALIISLIILLLLTLISVSAMKVNSLEEKMAGNDRNRNTAFQAAEAALRAGEARILDLWRNKTPPQNPPVISDPANGTGSIEYFCNGSTDRARIDSATAAVIQDQPGVFHAVASDQKTSLVYGCGDCTVNCPVPDENNPAIWTNNNLTVEVQTGDTSLAAQPRYFVTYIYSWHPDKANANETPIYKFTVTARGVGKSDTSVVILRSYFGGSTEFAED
jgi:Tfp pilus assembly protein PilX